MQKGILVVNLWDDCLGWRSRQLDCSLLLTKLNLGRSCDLWGGIQDADHIWSGWCCPGQNLTSTSMHPLLYCPDVLGCWEKGEWCEQFRIHQRSGKMAFAMEFMLRRWLGVSCGDNMCSPSKPKIKCCSNWSFSICSLFESNSAIMVGDSSKLP